MTLLTWSCVQSMRVVSRGKSGGGATWAEFNARRDQRRVLQVSFEVPELRREDNFVLGALLLSHSMCLRFFGETGLPKALIKRHNEFRPRRLFRRSVRVR